MNSIPTAVRSIDEFSFDSAATRNRATSGHQQKPRTVVRHLFGLESNKIARIPRKPGLHSTASRQIGIFENVRRTRSSDSGQSGTIVVQRVLTKSCVQTYDFYDLK